MFNQTNGVSMNTIKIISVFGLALLFFSCSSIKVMTDYDRQADFTKYKTYQWFDAKDKAAKAGEMSNTLTAKRIHRAVETELGAKGYDQVSLDPDFYVIFHTEVKDRVDVDEYGYTYGPWARPVPGYRREIDVNYYQEGTLILDIIDADSKELAWRGWGTGVVDPQSAEKKINEAAKKILANFPPLKK
jgi:hypothetical protein